MDWFTLWLIFSKNPPIVKFTAKLGLFCIIFVLLLQLAFRGVDSLLMWININELIKAAR